ncbi:MAG: hypothetical protein WEB30_07065 [Cyclobacteriaceae bacterium]
MITTTIKRKIIVTKVEVTKMERFVPFEIKLPANITRVTGLLVTASRK